MSQCELGYKSFFIKPAAKEYHLKVRHKNKNKTFKLSHLTEKDKISTYFNFLDIIVIINLPLCTCKNVTQMELCAHEASLWWEIKTQIMWNNNPWILSRLSEASLVAKRYKIWPAEQDWVTFPGRDVNTVLSNNMIFQASVGRFQVKESH